jgi:hypothetical protein
MTALFYYKPSQKYILRPITVLARMAGHAISCIFMKVGRDLLQNVLLIPLSAGLRFFIGSGLVLERSLHF